MKVRVERLRWLLLGLGATLLLLLAGLLGYGRYQALRAWHRALERTGASLTRETNGFTYSQSLRGRTVFTLHAAKAVQAANGTYALHDVSLILYRQAGGPPDRVYGADFEYDQTNGVARALGEVHMDLQAPGTAASKEGANSPATRNGGPNPGSPTEGTQEPETIHVKTSGLVFVRKLGVAGTTQDVEFRYGNLECHARGAEFDSGQGTVHLLADVQAGGKLRGQAVRLTAARADLDRQTKIVTLTRPEVKTAEARASSALAVLHLRSDGLLTAAEATGEVNVRRGEQVLEAANADIHMTKGTTLQTARLSGGVKLVNHDPSRPMEGRADAVETSFGPGGAPEQTVLRGNAFLQTFAAVPGVDPERGQRSMGGDRITVSFAKGGTSAAPTPQQVRIEGRAKLVATSPARGRANPLKNAPPLPAHTFEQTSVSADDLLVKLVPGTHGQIVPESVGGAGHTLWEQVQPGRASSRSTADKLSVRFAQGTREQVSTPGHADGALGGQAQQVQSAVQEGHVTWRTVAYAEGSSAEKITEATADRAAFMAEQHHMTLTGRAHVWNREQDLTAERIELDSQSRDVDATGQVRATLLPAGVAHDTRAATEPTHVAASHAAFLQQTGKLDFFGSDANPVRLWQGPSQLQAAFITVDKQRNTLAAKPEAPGGSIHAVLVQGRDAKGTASIATQTAAGRPGRAALPEGAANNVLRVVSSRLDYSADSHEARFTGNTVLSGLLGQVRGQSALVLLRGGPRPEVDPGASQAARLSADVSDGLLGQSVEKVIFSGKVLLQQAGRSGAGEQLLYTPGNGSFVLTGTPGHPPHVLDAEQGRISGDTLLFRTSDNTVVVAGARGQNGQAQGRVRTELNLRP